ncbi:MAG: mechanosensitive ion channel family protein [Steroidobacteraceae bacterium]
MTVVEHISATLGLSEWAGALTVAVRIVLIVVLALVAQAVASRLIRTIRLRIAARMHAAEQQRRAETLGRVFRYVAAVVIAAISAILVLNEVGISVAPFLGAAGVVGLAIGFGAQSLVKDYFTGMLLLLEGQITRGDIVEVAGKGGVVEDLTLRYVELRDYDGHVHFVPNGEITTVTNMTRGFAFAVIDAGVAYREDLAEVQRIVRRTAKELEDDPAFRDRILEPFELAGVERWDDSAVVVRGRFKVRAIEQWSVRREFLQRLKAAFDREGIEIPFPHVTVYAGRDRQGEAPPFRVARARSAAGGLS